MAQKLSGDKLAEALAGIPKWAQQDDREAIERTFLFKDFNEAFGFMTRAALICEAMDHHPEWFNVYRTVEVTLTTHDSDGITEKDITLAQAMDNIAN